MKKAIVITGIICITVIETVALYNGINGTLLTISVGAIAGAVGVAVPTPKGMT